MKKTLFLAVATCLLAGMSASAALDKKFYNKIADAVWKNSDNIFNPEKTIPDSLTANNSAVIIAWSDDIDVDHIRNTTIYSSTGETNRMKKEHVKRVMVKLLDQSAIDNYSEMEFGHQREIKFRGFIIYSLREAFGARIHKPTGEIVTVDLSQAVETGDGKKGKDDRHYKLAIPGLEPGDILDYFEYSEELAESYDLDPANLSISSKYPVLTRRVNISTVPSMTVEYKCYNGVPNPTRLDDRNDRQAVKLEVYNVPAVNFKRYLMPARQLPFIRCQFINNNDRRVMARHARSGGLHGNIHAGRIISEFGDFLKGVDYDSPLNGKVLKMVKDGYQKQHPDATPRELADAAYLALNYCDLTAKTESEQTSGQFERTLILSDVLNKLGVYPADSVAIGMINPRNDVPVDDISAWNEARMVVKTPDAMYFMPRQFAIAAGEMPGRCKGEKALLYYGNRRDITKRTLVREYYVPGKRISENTLATNDTIRLIDDDRLAMTSSLNFKGGIKSELNELTNSTEWISEVEDFFNIEPNKRFKDKGYDAVGRENELKTYLTTNFKTIYGVSPDSVTAASITSRGIRPDVPDMNMRAEMEFDGLVEPLGSELSLAIGKLAGMPEPLTENEQNRLLDVMLPFINQESHQIVVKKPEGYRFDPASVDALTRNVAEMHGQFFVQPKINEDGDLEITIVMREKFADVPLAMWPNFMHLVDEEAAFADASVILVRE